MRCYLVKGPDVRRYAGTMAEARETRENMMETHALKKKEVEIEQVEVPTAKEGLLKVLNEICALHLSH